jgi:hypothetical protein
MELPCPLHPEPVSIFGSFFHLYEEYDEFRQFGLACVPPNDLDIIGAFIPGSEQLTVDERDRLVERGAARTDVTHRGVLVTDRHAAEEDAPIRG